MKRNSLLFIFTCVLFVFAKAQNAPKKFNYQAVARDATGNFMAGKTISVQVKLTDGNNNQYVEVHSGKLTNAYGLFTLEIGGGVSSNSFNGLNWQGGQVTIQIGIDPNNGTNFTQITATAAPLLSVPYALYADFAAQTGTAGNGTAYTNGGGIRLQGSKFLANVDKTSIDTIGGKLSLVGVKGGLIDSISPAQIGKANATAGQVLKWNGNFWAPGTDETIIGTGSYVAGPGIKIVGTTISNTGDIDSTNDVNKGSPAGGDLVGTYPNPTIKPGALGLSSLSTAGVTAGQIIKYDGTNWIYAKDETAGTTSASQYKIDNVTIDTNAIGQLRVKKIDSTHIIGIGLEDLPTHNAQIGQTFVYDGNKWTIGGSSSSASQWTTVGSNIYYSTGKVGIGKASPVYKLDVAGTIHSDSIQTNLVLTDTLGAARSKINRLLITERLVFPLGAADGYVLTSGPLGNATWKAPGASSWLSNGKNIYYNTGNVGIGVNIPANALSIKGGIIVDQGNTNADDYQHVRRGGPYLTFGHDSSGEGISSLRIPGKSNYNGLDLFTNFETRLTVTHIGFVGVGTTNPSTLFTVGLSSMADKHNVQFQAYSGTGNRLLYVDPLGVIKDTSFAPSSTAVTGVGNILVRQNVISTKYVLDSIQQIKSIASASLALYQGTNQVFAAATSGSVSITSDLFTVDDKSGSPGIRFTAKNVGIGLSGDPKSRLHVGGGVRIDSLAGTGIRMVVANAQGYLSTQALPSTSLLQGSDIRIANGRINLDRTIDSTVAITIPTGKNFRINGTGTQRVLLDSANVGVKMGIGVGVALSKMHTSGSFRSDSLKGTGTRILVARANGIIDTLNNKTGVLTYNGTTLSWATASTGLPVGLADQTLRYNGTLAKWDTASNLINTGTLVTIGKMAQKGTNVLVVNGRIKTDNITESSDVRYKKEIATLADALSKVNQLRGVSYYWKSDSLKSKKDIGLIAQELEQVYPELVDTDEKGYKSVRYSHLVPILVEAIKEQQSQIASLKNELSTRDTKAQTDEKRIQSMEASLQTMNAQIQLLLELSGKSDGVKASK